MQFYAVRFLHGIRIHGKRATHGHWSRRGRICMLQLSDRYMRIHGLGRFILPGAFVSHGFPSFCHYGRLNLVARVELRSFPLLFSAVLASKCARVSLRTISRPDNRKAFLFSFPVMSEQMSML